MTPLFTTTIATGLVALIPKVLTDAYDYFFTNEKILVSHSTDRTILTSAQCAQARKAYTVYQLGVGDPQSVYKTQVRLVATLNDWFGTHKSCAQMMRICRSTA